MDSLLTLQMNMCTWSKVVNLDAALTLQHFLNLLDTLLNLQPPIFLTRMALLNNFIAPLAMPSALCWLEPSLNQSFGFMHFIIIFVFTMLCLMLHAMHPPTISALENFLTWVYFIFFGVMFMFFLQGPLNEINFTLTLKWGFFLVILKPWRTSFSTVLSVIKWKQLFMLFLMKLWLTQILKLQMHII